MKFERRLLQRQDQGRPHAYLDYHGLKTAFKSACARSRQDRTQVNLEGIFPDLLGRRFSPQNSTLRCFR